MTTAVRRLSGGTLLLKQWPMINWSPRKQTLLVAVLGICVMFSALGVIYLKQAERQSFIQIESMQAQNDQLHTQYGQLLLEESTWGTQSRIQAIAQNQLNMAMPASNAIKMIKLSN